MNDTSTILFNFLHSYIQKLKSLKEILSLCGHTYNVITFPNNNNIFSKYTRNIKQFLLLYNVFLGDTNLLEKIKINNCFQIDENKEFNTDLCCISARNGNLDIIKWLFINICNQYTIDTNLIEKICANAAEGGYLNIIEWITKINQTNISWFIPYFACRSGHLEIVIWAYMNKVNIDANNVLTPAAENNHIDIIKWFLTIVISKNENEQFYNISTICCGAARLGNLNILKWLHKNNLDTIVISKKYTGVCDNAVCNGHLDVLKWLRKKAYYWSENTFHIAIMYGHIHILKWIYDNNCPFKQQECMKIIKMKILEISGKTIKDSDHNTDIDKYEEIFQWLENFEG